MNPFLLYIIKAALSLGGLYIVYLLFLGRDTLYERNRFFILLSVFASLIFPLIVIETRQPIDIQFFGKDLTGIIIENNPDMLVNPAETGSADRVYRLVLNIYIAGLIFFSIRTLAELLSLLYLIIRQKNRKDNIIRLRNHRISGFSAFGYIFIDSRLNSDIARDIIKHEQKHLKNYHFLDILLIEFLKAVQWFNPFVYLVDKSLREVHEFQADEECLNSGITVRRYQGLLLNQVFRTNIFSTSDGFSHPTIIKKRIIMMTRKRSGYLANLKMLATLPVIIFLLISFSTTSPVEMIADYASYPLIGDSYPSLPPPPVVDNVRNASGTITTPAPVSSEKAREPYVVVEEMPVFPGGDSELLKYLSENARYPESAKEGNHSERVIVRFCITETGSVNRVSVLKGVEPVLDAEAVRVVSSLPTFKPGYQGGIAVPVWYMVPVTFAQRMNETSLPSTPPPPPSAESEVLYEETIVAREDPDHNSIAIKPSLLAEQMPVYPGGDAALLKYLSKKSRYPSEAKISGKEGRVVVRFCVTETGDVDLVSVLKGVDPELDAEAIRLVSTLSGFKPAMQGGKPVPVWYSVPITFTLI